MKITKHLKSLKKRKPTRGQVFIMATLVIVVYTVSMIAVVTEVSINRNQTDNVDITHMVNEYLTDMKYQLELGLYDYVNNGASNNTVIAGIQSFVTSFSEYASAKGVDTSINLRLNEFMLNANTSITAFPVPATISTNYSETMSIAINSSILFQSSNSNTKVSGIFIHYFAINAFITSTNTLTLTEKDFYGNTLNFISGATFISPAGVIDYLNGSYTGNFAGSQLSITLPSGLMFFS